MGNRQESDLVLLTFVACLKRFPSRNAPQPAATRGIEEAWSEAAKQPMNIHIPRKLALCMI